VGGDVTTSAPLQLALAGAWGRTMTATMDGKAVELKRPDAATVIVSIPAGHHQLKLLPR
jgi:uncharacterized membrane protein YfhO